MLGAALAKELRNNGLWFKHVAKTVGVPPATFYQYTMGKNPMPKCVALFVCEKFGIDFKKLEEEVANASSEQL